MSNVRFEVSRNLDIPAGVVYSELVDWKGHEKWVPLTTVEVISGNGQLQYKTVWRGSTLVAADRAYQSSKTCADCGAMKAKLLLSEREDACTTCGTFMDRDLNAAVNLARLGTTSPTGSDPVAGRGGEHKPVRPSGRTAAADETSISKRPARAA